MGYGIISDVERISDRHVRLRAGTLHAALDRLEGEGLVDLIGKRSSRVGCGGTTNSPPRVPSACQRRFIDCVGMRTRRPGDYAGGLLVYGLAAGTA
jgi:Transcriptional regulator PadR-like family